MNEKLKELFIATLNIAEENYRIVENDNCKFNFLSEIASQSNLGIEPEEVEEILEKELKWY